jgi:hypothetical protein
MNHNGREGHEEGGTTNHSNDKNLIMPLTELIEIAFVQFV